jgi:putative SOS response-associated peptidase YedK
MCGRYFLDTLPELLAGQFRVHKHPVYQAHWNIAPTQPILAVRLHGGDRAWASLRWGLVPHWAKDLSIGARTFNARGETLAEKPAFRAAFKARRCIIPASGFYEWQALPAGKQPWAIRPANDPCFGFGGLWEHWSGEDGEVVETATIVTTAANAKMAPIHDRMPLILAPEDYERWLAGTPGEASSLIRPALDSALRMHPVGRAVGHVRNDHPGLAAPLDEPA